MLHSIDRSGRLVSVSNRWLAKMGYTREEVLGRRSVEFLTPESRQYALDVVLPAYFQTGACNDVPYQFVTKSGEVLDIELSAIAEFGADGQVERSFAVLIDVTARKRAEAAARDLARREEAALAEAAAARELDRLKSHLISAVSHELRTPITTIRGFGSFLVEELESRNETQLHDYARQVISSAKRLQLLVDDLLDAVSIEAGTFSVHPEEVDAAERIRDVLESVSPLVLEARLDLFVELPDHLPAFMDGRRIGQVLLNLVGNAIKFTPDGGTITVAARRDGDRVRCAVADTGIGIAPSDVPRLFRRFSQIEPGPRNQVGTGLGLSICKAIIEAHGGEIGVASEKGLGSTFWFTLPAEEAF